MILLRDRGWKRIFRMFFPCRRSSFFFIFLSRDFLKNYSRELPIISANSVCFHLFEFLSSGICKLLNVLET